jgi:hypothetical protein
MTTTERPAAAPAPAAPSAGRQKLRAFIPLAIDLVVPTVVYLLLAAVDVPTVWALTLAGVATGVVTLVGTIRRRRLDGVGILVLVEIATSAALLFLTDDPRLILLKPSIYTLIAAGYLYTTCFVGRPVSFAAATPMATGGDPVRLVAYHETWETSAAFRRRQRMITAVFGTALLLEAIGRAVVIYSLPADDIGTALTLSQIPGFVLLAVALLISRAQAPALGRLVDAVQERQAREAPPAAA